MPVIYKLHLSLWKDLSSQVLNKDRNLKKILTKTAREFWFKKLSWQDKLTRQAYVKPDGAQ